MARKGWDQLSPTYRERLEKAGISQRDYESGQSIDKGRGHGKTPEHPRNYDPSKYPQYHQEREKLHRQLDRRKEELFGGRPRWNTQRAARNVRDKPPSLALIRWALKASDGELEDALRQEPDTFYFLGY